MAIDVTRNLVDLEGYHVVNKSTYTRVLWERRLMFGATGLTVIGILFFIISISTSSWAIVDAQPNVKTNISIQLHLGIWGEYRTDYNATHSHTQWFSHFPPPNRPRFTDKDLPHFYRTQAVFAIIALALMICGLFLSLYSFRHHRYMYKRLTAGIMAIIAMCILVVVEVLVHSINEWKPLSAESGTSDKVVTTTVQNSAAQNEDYYEYKDNTYGYSTGFAWFVFVIYIIAAIVFLIGGRKNKGMNAATAEFEQEDRPVNLG